MQIPTRPHHCITRTLTPNCTQTLTLFHEDVALEQKTMLNGKDYEGSPAEKMVLIVASIVANPIQEVILQWENLDDQLVIILAAALRD